MFYPSAIEDKIYDVVIDHIVVAGNEDIYDMDVYDEVHNLMINEFDDDRKFNMWVSPYPDETGGVISVSWWEAGRVHSMGLLYRNVRF